VYCGFPLLVGDRLLGTLAFASYTPKTIAADELETLSTVAQYVAVAMDRTLREQALRDAQQSLSQHAETLETKVAERTVKLHETIAQLESFSYSIAHDLRAPIRALRGYCDILQHEFTLPQGGEAIVARLQRASNRLDALTRDLLKFSKISRQDVLLEPVDVAEVVNDILLITPGLNRDVLTIEPPLEHVLAQRSLLQQCLANLFDNALKFAAPDRPPRILVRCERRWDTADESTDSLTRAFNPATPPDDAPRPQISTAPATPAARIRIWIEDNGVGIAPESHQKIFGIFERVSGHDHIEGTGIGLAIVASATHQMSGTCGVESTPGVGSRFWLEFAAAPRVEDNHH
jgi:signal transduction histidine kinase